MPERTDIVKELSDKYIENLRKPEKTNMGNGYATLHIRIDTLKKEERDLVWGAINLLSRAGIKFDTGCGFGNIDCELDWSLKGAYITVRPIKCSNYNKCKKILRFGKEIKNTTIWVRMKRGINNYVFTYPFCSKECIKTYIGEHNKREPNNLIKIIALWVEE